MEMATATTFQAEIDQRSIRNTSINSISTEHMAIKIHFIVWFQWIAIGEHTRQPPNENIYSKSFTE